MQKKLQFTVVSVIHCEATDLGAFKSRNYANYAEFLYISFLYAHSVYPLYAFIWKGYRENVVERSNVVF